MTALRLRFDEVAPGQPYHAALVQVRGVGRPTGMVHTHDFVEFALIRRGSADHLVNGERIPMDAGDFTLIRPADSHVFVASDNAGFELINIAFPAPQWQAFCALTGVGSDPWNGAGAPGVISARRGASESFTQLLRRYAAAPRSIHLIAFQTAVSEHLCADSGCSRPVPDWLERACAAVEDEEGLRRGVSAMIQVAAVSQGHLTRLMTRHYKTTPVAFVNRRRLEHAALLLTTTGDPVGRIAQRCGFASQSYFNRRFTRFAGCPPRDYRQRARAAIAP